MNPYTEAMQMITRNHGTSGAGGMAKLILSLYNQQCGFAISECIGSFDRNNLTLAIRMVADYATYGETKELCDAGKLLADKYYPGLWELGNAMAHARYVTREKWDADNRQADIDEVNAAEAQFFTDHTKLIPTEIAISFLNSDVSLYADYHWPCGEWRDTELDKKVVCDAIEAAGGAELTGINPNCSFSLAVRINQQIYYVSTDYDAREAYLDTIRPPRQQIPHTISVPPRIS